MNIIIINLTSFFVIITAISQYIFIINIYCNQLTHVSLANSWVCFKKPMRSPDQKLGRRSRTSMTSDAEEIDPSHQQLNYIPLQCLFVGSFDTLRWRVLGGTWVFSTVQNASIIGFKWSFVNAAWLLEYSNLHCIQSSFFKRHTVRIMTFGNAKTTSLLKRNELIHSTILCILALMVLPVLGVTCFL